MIQRKKGHQFNEINLTKQIMMQ